MSLAKNVRRRRDALGVSQVELARRISVAQSRISDIETGVVVSPNVDRLVALAAALDTTVDALLAGTGKCPYNPAAAAERGNGAGKSRPGRPHQAPAKKVKL